MIASTSFTLPTEGSMLGVMTSVLTLGTLTLVLLALAAVVAAGYLINLALSVLVELNTHMALLYGSSDPAVKLLMLCIADYMLIKAFPLVKRSVWASLARK